MQISIPIALIAALTAFYLINWSKKYKAEIEKSLWRITKFWAIAGISAAVTFFGIGQQIDIARGKSTRNFMIKTDTEITETSEGRVRYSVQNTSEKAIQEIIYYLGPSVAQDEIIKDAIEYARNNNYLFNKRSNDNEDTKIYLIAPKYVKDGKPLLLTETEAKSILLRIARAGNLNQDTITLMRYVLTDRKIIRNLEYEFKLYLDGQPDPEKICLSHYDKLGLIAGHINMLKEESEAD